MEQVLARPASAHRGTSRRGVIPAKDAHRSPAWLLIDVRSGGFLFVEAKAVLLATAAARNVRYHTPSGQEHGRPRHALRFGCRCATWRWSSSIRPALRRSRYAHDRTVLEKASRLRGHLLDGSMRRFMGDYDPIWSARRATWSAAMYAEMRAGRTTPNGGLYIKMSHLGPESVRRQFRHGRALRGLRFRSCGGLVEVVPTAHYCMGGVGATSTPPEVPGLFVAGEIERHAWRQPLGGNGVANSTVFGGIAVDTCRTGLPQSGPARAARGVLEAEMGVPCIRSPQGRRSNGLRERLLDTMWNDVGVIATAPVSTGTRGAQGDRSELCHRRGGGRPRFQSELARLAHLRS